MFPSLSSSTMFQNVYASFKLLITEYLDLDLPASSGGTETRKSLSALSKNRLYGVYVRYNKMDIMKDM